MDMRKAYDIVEWDFVAQALMDFGFPEKIVHICILFIINGHPKGWIACKTSLRQGDYLFLYIFVLCIESFSKQYQLEVKQNTFQFHLKCSQVK